MGFFAGELAAILQTHVNHPDASPWSILSRMGIHPQQIDRLKKAAEDLAQVATLQSAQLQQLRQELELSPGEWARLQAGAEADTFLRLLLYHNYSLEDAANKANAVFAAALKDKLATGGRSESVFPTLTEHDQAGIHPGPQHHRPRGPRRKDAIEF